jgi:hypothetical protein
LAAIEIARSSVTGSVAWKNLVTELQAGRKKSKWFLKVRTALEVRGLKGKIWDSPAEAISERREIADQFSQFCFHHHLNVPRGTSADQIRFLQPFGVYPFLYRSSPFLSRYLFSFILSNWRWIDGGKCRGHPRECDHCQVHNSSFHVLFECVMFDSIREDFKDLTEREFCFEVLTLDGEGLPKAVTEVGKKIFDAIVSVYAAPLI